MNYGLLYLLDHEEEVTYSSLLATYFTIITLPSLLHG